MISRRSAKAIAEAYHMRFTHYVDRGPFPSSPVQFEYMNDEMYDFLYAYDFDSWLLNAIKLISRRNSRGLLEFVMRLHTGESQANATPDWDWRQRQALGQRILKDLAQSLIHARNTDPKFDTYGERKKCVDEMQRTLELDGYIYSNAVLLIPEETVLEEKEEEGVLQSLIITLKLSDPAVLRHHLELSATHYYASKWDDSISNSRKVLEGVLQQAANRYSESNTGKPVRVREYLERVGLLERKEQETIAKVYGLLSNTGGHPYIAERDQARLMRHLSLIFCQFVLLRLRGVLSALQAPGA